MNRSAVRRDPQIRSSGDPDWFDKRGHQMRQRAVTPHQLTIANDTDEVAIRRMTGQSFLVSWRLLPGDREQMAGSAKISYDELRAASGLSDESSEDSDLVIEEYGGDVAKKRAYLRWRNFLIFFESGPGGDSRVPVYLTKEIQDAIQTFIG